jgi:putative transposase
MTNHVHLLMTPTTPSGIGNVIQLVARRYVQRFNATYQRTGHVWGERYKATIVETNHYFFACHRYIELNPVRAGLVEQPSDYPWSSHRMNAFGDTNRLVTPHESYEALGATPGDRQAAYRAMFIDELSDSTLAEIRDATNRGWALGSRRFRDEVAALLKRRTEPARKGRRPRRNDENRG